MKINLKLTLLASWFCFVFFAGAAAFALISHLYVFMPGLLAVSGLGFFMLFYFGNVEMDRDAIRQATLSGKYEIKWDQIRQIELRQSEATIIFQGDNKVLTVLGRQFWQGEDVQLIMDFISTQAKNRDIDFIEGQRSFRFPQNTKV